MIDRAVPKRLIELATTVCITERFARGKRVIRATKKVPAIPIALGISRLVFSTGSSLMRNKTVISRRKQRVEILDTTSTSNGQEAESLSTQWLSNNK
jgi:hypothetical protein